jgi:hypothetical protein
MVAKAKNGHVNIKELFKLNFIATFNIRSPEKDSEKNIVLCKKDDDITPFGRTLPPERLLYSHLLLGQQQLLLHSGGYKEMSSIFADQ